VLAPRHPQRFAEVEDLVRHSGFVFDLKSRVNGRVIFDKPVMVVDTIGDLMDFYAIADIAFVGGSLVDGGGHNPLEPARLGKPVLFGPYMGNFRELAAEMKQRGAAIEVNDATSLCRTVAELLNDADRRDRVGRLAYELATDGRGVLPATMALAERYLQ
jgi:3-deoxy-D-manno-octulosonic-acid transferase